MTDTLPTGAEDVAWDLTDLYAGTDDPRLTADLDAADAEADALDAKYRDTIAALTPFGLAELLGRYEALRERAAKAGGFASLNWTQNTEDPARGALLQRVTERGAQLSQKLVFMELELADAPDEVAAAWLADPRPGALPPLAGGAAPLPALPAHGAGREDPGREVGHRPQRVGSLLQRNTLGRALRAGRREAEP